MDSQPEIHRSRLNCEERFRLAREGAAREGNAEARCERVGSDGQSFHVVDAVTPVRGRAGNLEDGEVPGDTPATVLLID